MKFIQMVVTKEAVVYPDSAQTHSFKKSFDLSFTYEDDNGKTQEGFCHINLLGNNKQDLKITPNMPEVIQACICNSFFYQYNKIYSETMYPPK